VQCQNAHDKSMKTKSKTRTHSLLGSIAKEGKREKFQKLEWLEKCEIDWRLANGMGQDR
jgi:hypothetical protein